MKVLPQFSSHICPRCHSMMTDHGRRRVKCPRCGMEDDRDHVSIINLAKTAAIMLGIQYLEALIRFILRDYEKRFPAQGPLKAPAQGRQRGRPPTLPPGILRGSWVGGLMNLMPRTFSRSQPKARAAKRVSSHSARWQIEPETSVLRLGKVLAGDDDARNRQRSQRRKG